MRLPGGQRVMGQGLTLKRLVEIGYGLASDQVEGGPSWVGHDTFDIEAKAESAASMEDLNAMLRNLLADRFGLQVRREPRMESVYLMTIGPEGPKMTPHEPKTGGVPSLLTKVQRPLHIEVNATASRLSTLATRLRPFLDRPVADRTGLSGSYDFDFAFTMQPPDSMREGAIGHDGMPIDFSGPTIFKAVRELGLRLDPGKIPLESVIIAGVQHPTDN